MKIAHNQPISLKIADNSADTVNKAKLREACTDFEAMMLHQMLTVMRKSIPKGGLFKAGHIQEMQQSLLDQEVAQNIANGKGMGIGEAMYKKIIGQVHKTTREK